MTQIRPRMSARFTIMLMIVALLVTALPVAAFAAAPATSAAAPAHDKGKPEKPGKPDKDAACSRKEVKRDSERGVKAAERWHLRLRTEDGKRLGVRRLEDGRCSPIIGIGIIYRVTARVPKSLRPTLDGATIVQHREEGDDTWKTVKEVPVGSDGRIRTTFRAREQHMNRHDYRVAVLASRAGVAPAGTAAATSGTTSATGVSVIVVNFVNDSGKNMNLQIPTAPTGAAGDPPPWGQVEVGLAAGATRAFIYRNAPSGIAAGFTMTNSPCHTPWSCAPRIPEWSCHTLQDRLANCFLYVWPYDQLRDANGNLYPACTDVNPQLAPGGTYDITLKPGTNQSSDYIRGYLSGPLGGIGTPDTTCIFSTTTGALDWFAGHPGHWLEAALALAAAVVLLELLVAVIEDIAVDAVLETTAERTTAEEVTRTIRLQALFDY